MIAIISQIRTGKNGVSFGTLALKDPEAGERYPSTKLCRLTGDAANYKVGTVVEAYAENTSPATTRKNEKTGEDQHFPATHWFFAVAIAPAASTPAT